MVWKRVAPRVALASSTSLADLFENGLDGAHDEGQADEDHGDDDADGGVGDAERNELPDDAVGRIDRGQRDAGHCRGQGEGQIDHRIENAPAGKAVAHQNPGDQGAENDIDAGGDQRRDEADPQGAKHPRIGCGFPEPIKAEPGTANAERDHGDQE